MKQDGSRLVFHAALQTERKHPRALLPGSRIARRGGSEELAKEGARQRGRSGQKEAQPAEAQGCHSPSLETQIRRGRGRTGERGGRGRGPACHHPGEKRPLPAGQQTQPAAAAACIPARASSSLAAGTFISGRVSASFPGDINKPRR